MKTATVDQLLSWGPCWLEEPDGEARIRELAGDVTAFTALDVLRREDLSVEDRLWVALRPELIEERTLYEFACDAAEHVQPEDVDPRLLAAIATRRAWLRGAVGDKGLAVARAVAGAAARAAARDAARAAEQAWQLDHLIEMIEGDRDGSA